MIDHGQMLEFVTMVVMLMMTEICAGISNEDPRHGGT